MDCFSIVCNKFSRKSSGDVSGIHGSDRNFDSFRIVVYKVTRHINGFYFVTVGKPGFEMTNHGSTLVGNYKIKNFMSKGICEIDSYEIGFFNPYYLVYMKGHDCLPVWPEDYF